MPATAGKGDAVYFDSPAAFRRWLEAHHASADELLVGFHKAHTGRPTLTWPESVDEALCVGWIDGIRRRVDDDRYTIRFTPRRRHSIWSLVNIRRVAALTAEGRMQPSGLRAFEARRDATRRTLGCLCVRAAGTGRAQRGRRTALHEAPEGLSVLPGAAARLPEDRDALGDECEESRDARDAPGRAHRRLGGWPAHRAVAPLTAVQPGCASPVAIPAG